MLKIKIKSPQIIQAIKKVTINDEDHAYIEKITGAHVPSVSCCMLTRRDVPNLDELIDYVQFKNHEHQEKQKCQIYQKIKTHKRALRRILGRRIREAWFKSGGQA